MKFSQNAFGWSVTSRKVWAVDVVMNAGFKGRP